VHSAEMDPGTLPMAKDKFISYLDSIQSYLTDEQFDRLNELIASLPDDLHLVHGDYQMKNIMVVDDEPMLIDMDTISTGQPIFDLQALYVSYVAFPEDEPDNLQKFFGIPNELGGRIWDKIVRYYFETTDEGKINEINSKIKLLAMIRFMYIVTSTDLKTGELGEKRIKRSQDSIAELIGSVGDLNI